MSKRTKWGYIIFMSGLTATAVTACKWQTTKYYRAVDRWKIISAELNTDQATGLAQINDVAEAYPYKYVKTVGQLSPEYILIDRPRGERLGFLMMRVLKYNTPLGTPRQIIACDGWIPENIIKGQNTKDIDYLTTKQPSEYKGLLKLAEKTDYLHGSFDKQTIRKSGMQTYIDIDEVSKQLKAGSDELNSQYYIQILKPLGDTSLYPVKYTKKDFELPYLTPAKHKDYATFWGGAAIVGTLAILKVLRM